MKTERHKYALVMREILKKIETGELPNGSRLPSARQMGEQLGIHYHTVRHAYNSLSNKGYLVAKTGSGTFVTDKIRTELDTNAANQRPEPRSDQIGILLPLTKWGYYTENLVKQLHFTADRKKLTLRMATVGGVNIEASEQVRDFYNQGCCAIVIPWLGKNQCLTDLHHFLRLSDLPVVLPEQVHGLEKNWYRIPECRKNHTVTSVALRGEYFQKLGYENIAMLGAYDDRAEHLRCKVVQYLDWVRRKNLPTLLELVEDNCSMSDMDRIIDRWLPMKGKLAVIAYHDDLALNFIDACHRKKIQVPEDFAVIGHQKNPHGYRKDTNLSTMQCAYEHIAEGMIAHAQALSRGSSDQLKALDPQQILVRKTCGGKAAGMDDAIDALTFSEVASTNRKNEPLLHIG